ncbi:hypothetical protein Ae717Ps2_6606c [Pseudonocardia sp. Ae717_Ps2]|uniref:hypothetical protein n=1 Tax=Pseudonocardia sp. Ae717_Ps2 TaxID=1885573 RepID=UPI00095B328F|nr:hypothetical protein [Pseudonocardia sp. Ae717_Ps2]OLM28267.1 hypothetical protein Ae717Ps2_6606c [Pseudonocardia sp. Ae717_Ps2]
MRAVTGRPAHRAGWWLLLRRVWPLGALLVAGVIVLASPGLQALLTVLIWASWLLIGVCAVTSSPRVRHLGLQLVVAGGQVGAAVLRMLLVQYRRLRTRVRGELAAGERS